MTSLAHWRTAFPLWSLALQEPTLAPFNQPVLLRFASDSFVPELLAAVQQIPPVIGPLVARYETRRRPAAGWLPTAGLLPSMPALKLYQPVHGRFYAVAASLVEAQPGLPEVRPAPDDQFSFVVRRLAPLDPAQRLYHQQTHAEFAWDGQGWQPVAPLQVLPAEERHPLFVQPHYDPPLVTPPQPPVPEPKRHFRFGLVPVHNREAYQAAPLPSPLPPLPDPRLADFSARILEALSRLPDLDGALAPGASTIALLDLVDFLEWHLPGRWGEIPFRPEWAAGLATVWAERRRILTGGPDLPLYDLRPVLRPADLDDLLRWVATLLAESFRAGREGPPPGLLAEAKAGPLYVIRCLCERPQDPERPVVVSPPTWPFQLASFYDSRAPQRPVAPMQPDRDRTAILKTLAKLVLPKLPRPKAKPPKPPKPPAPPKPPKLQPPQAPKPPEAR